MYPVVIGIAALAAWALSGCGDGKGTDLFGDEDAGTGGNENNRVRATGGRSSTGAAGSTAGSSGVAGTGGTAGTSGSGGTVDMDAGAEDAGMDAGAEAGLDGGSDAGLSDASTDAFISDAMNQQAVAYHFGMIYGSNPIVGLNGTGTLYFSNQNSCELLGGSFEAQSQSGDSFAMSVDLSGMQSLDFCTAEVTLPLAGGVFEGMTWLLGNKSTVASPTESFEILACGSQEDGGTGLENCSGALNISNP
jgi:hypothetical protein